MDADNSRSRHPSAAGSYAITNADSVLDAIDASAPASRMPPLKVVNPLLCPCCKQPVTVPAPEIVIDHYGITPLEGRIFQAVWKGKGLPVITERIFTAMYIDDPDGGPTPDKMYLAFKVALCHLRQKLEGSGIGIANVGYRRGYRLVIEGKFPNA